MWSEEEIKQRIVEDQEKINQIKEEYGDIDTSDKDSNDLDYKEVKNELDEIEKEISTLEWVINDNDRPIPKKAETLEELLQPIRNNGFFVQVYPNEAENMKILTISLDGVPNRSYKFDLETFLKKLLLSCTDYTPYGHLDLELNVGLLKL